MFKLSCHITPPLLIKYVNLSGGTGSSDSETRSVQLCDVLQLKVGADRLWAYHDNHSMHSMDTAA